MKNQRISLQGVAAAISVAIVLGACSSANHPASSLKVAPLSSAQARADFDEIVNKIKGLYGPRDYKEQRFKMTLDQLIGDATAALSQATSDDDVFATFAKFLTHLQDGHTGITLPANANPIQSYKIPLVVTPVEQSFLVVKVGDEIKDQGIAVGDELLSVDGKTPEELLGILKQYRSFGNALSDRHNITYLFSRKAYYRELVPTKRQADLSLRKADGTSYQVSLNWRMEPYYQHPDFIGRNSGMTATTKSFIGYAGIADEFNEVTQGSLVEMGAAKPYFVNDDLVKKYQLKPVEIDDAHQKKYGLTKAKYDEIYAATYNYNGTTLLLVRQPSYSPEKESDVELQLNIYRAIFDQYEPLVQGMVLDQNHNPGGYLAYVSGFYRLFIKHNSPNLVQSSHADRLWINSLKDAAKKIDPTLKKEDALNAMYYASVIEKANEQGKNMSPPMPLEGGNLLTPDDKYTWGKPVVILADELAGSCGDILPMFMTRSGRAKFFGQRTMGLGGNVEEVANLTATGATLRLTRGLFNYYRADNTYDVDSWVENNGVTPDQTYVVTVADFRSGFQTYFETMSQYAAVQIAAAATIGASPVNH